MSNFFTGTSDIWASLVANIGPLLVLVGEKHVKAYFKTMHKTSHHLLFAASPIGLVTAVTTLIRLSEFQVLKRMIGRQFEPHAQVLLDVTSVSCGEVGLELISGCLEQSVNPSPDNVAMFWIYGEKRDTPEKLAEWIRANEWLVTKHIEYTFIDIPNMYSCYHRRSGIAMASAVRKEGPSHAVWLVREKALDLWEEGGWGKDGNDHRWEDDEFYLTHSSPPLSYTSREGPRAYHTKKLKKFCEEERTNICPSNTMQDTTCEATGVAIAHLSDVSHVVTASENHENWWLDALTYAFVFFSLCCNVGIVVAIVLTGGAPITAGLVGGGLLVTGAGSWLTALAVDSASEERGLELEGFAGKAAGFVSRDGPSGVKLVGCPNRAITSSRPRDYSHLRPLTKVVVPTLLVFLMVGGFFALYMGLRSSPWWVSLSALGVAAAASCARSMLTPTILQAPNDKVSGGISYATVGRWGKEWQLDFKGEKSDSLVDSYEVLCQPGSSGPIIYRAFRGRSLATLHTGVISSFSHSIWRMKCGSNLSPPSSLAASVEISILGGLSSYIPTCWHQAVCYASLWRC